MNTADPHVTYISSGMIKAATDAAGLHRRCRGERFTRLTLPVQPDGSGYHLTGMLHEPAEPCTPPPGVVEAWYGGGALPIRLDAPVDEGSPFADQATERLSAVERLRTLLAVEMPITLDRMRYGVSIPLRPERCTTY